MSASESADEVRAKHILVLGDSLGPIYNALYNQFFWLQWKRQEYEELFGKSQQRVDILNDAAPSFFHHLQDVLWDDLLIHLSRLTDRPDTGGKFNLTFTALPPLVHRDIRAEIQQLVDLALSSSAFARDWRNRRLAHHDLHLALGGSATPLAAASRLALKEALAALHAVLRRISSHYFDSDLQGEVIGSLTGAEQLIYVLFDGVQVAREREEKLAAGIWRPEDLQIPPRL